MSIGFQFLIALQAPQLADLLTCGLVMASLAADISIGAKIRTVKIDSKRSFHQGCLKDDYPELLNLCGGIVVVQYTPRPTLQYCDIDLMLTSNAVPHRLE